MPNGCEEGPQAMISSLLKISICLVTEYLKECIGISNHQSSFSVTHPSPRLGIGWSFRCDGASKARATAVARLLQERTVCRSTEAKRGRRRGHSHGHPSVPQYRPSGGQVAQHSQEVFWHCGLVCFAKPCGNAPPPSTNASPKQVYFAREALKHMQSNTNTSDHSDSGGPAPDQQNA